MEDEISKRSCSNMTLWSDSSSSNFPLFRRSVILHLNDPITNIWSLIFKVLFCCTINFMWWVVFPKCVWLWRRKIFFRCVCVVACTMAQNFHFLFYFYLFTQVLVTCTQTLRFTVQIWRNMETQILGRKEWRCSSIHIVAISTYRLGAAVG
jgi:hypothetical protein